MASSCPSWRPQFSLWQPQWPPDSHNVPYGSYNAPYSRHNVIKPTSTLYMETTMPFKQVTNSVTAIMLSTPSTMPPMIATIAIYTSCNVAGGVVCLFSDALCNCSPLCPRNRQGTSCHLLRHNALTGCTKIGILNWTTSLNWPLRVKICPWFDEHSFFLIVTLIGKDTYTKNIFPAIQHFFSHVKLF